MLDDLLVWKKSQLLRSRSLKKEMLDSRCLVDQDFVMLHHVMLMSRYESNFSMLHRFYKLGHVILAFPVSP